MVRQTSLNAYQEENERFTTQREKVLLFILNNPKSCDTEISEGTGLTINSTTGRRNFLLTHGFIEETGTKVSKTGKTVTCWSVTNEGVDELFKNGSNNN